MKGQLFVRCVKCNKTEKLGNTPSSERDINNETSHLYWDRMRIRHFVAEVLSFDLN